MLRGHGFTVYRDVDSALCTSERVAFLTNVLFAGPHQNIASHDEVSKREGDVSCGIGKSAVPPFRLKKNLNAPPASPVFKGDKATFHLANLGCVIYPDGDDPPAQVRRLDAAMVELERTLGS